MLVNLAFFLFVAMRYEYKPVEHVERFVPRKEPPPWARAQPVYGVVPEQVMHIHLTAHASFVAPPATVLLHRLSSPIAELTRTLRTALVLAVMSACNAMQSVGVAWD